MLLQVILSAPDRQEPSSFLNTAVSHGFVWRLLLRIEKAELLTPVSIFQLLLGAKPSAEVLKLTQAASPQPPSMSHQEGPSQLADTSGQAALDAQSTLNSTAAQLSSSNNSPQVTKPIAPLSVSQNAQPGSTTAGQDLGDKPSVTTQKAPLGLQGRDKQAGSAVNNDQTAVHTLLVLDFDWSMIEENSDTFVVRELGGWETFQRYKPVLTLLNKIINQIGLTERATLQGM